MSESIIPITDEQLAKEELSLGSKSTKLPHSISSLTIMNLFVVQSMIERIKDGQRQIEELENAITNGNALKDTPDLLEFLSNKLIKDYGESEDYHYHQAAADICAELRRVINKGG